MPAPPAVVPDSLGEILGPQWRDIEWRLSNLYWIVDEGGQAIRFAPNEEQLDFVRNLWTRNIILKARQLGISTLLELLQFDQALFNKNHNGVVIADTLPNAGKLFAKIEFAFDKLPQALKDALPIKSKASKTGLEFEHGSTIYVSTSSRGGTDSNAPDTISRLRSGYLRAILPSSLMCRN